MDQQYEKAKEIFLAVCNLDAPERKEVLDRECGDDAALRAEIESLQKYHEHDGAPPTTSGPAGSTRREGEQPGPTPREIGPYRVIREIGRGGMGVVYLAAASPRFL